MLKVSVSGEYITEGQLGRERTHYEFIKEIPEVPDNWILSMIKSRYLPMWVAEARKKTSTKWKPFHEVKSCHISDYKITDTSDGLVGKDVFEMEEKELQDVAAKYLLTEVPIPYTVPLKELRDRVALAYLKYVKGVKVDNNEDKEKLAFFRKNGVGEWILDFSGDSFILEDIEPKKENEQKTIEKKTLSELLNNNKEPDDDKKEEGKLTEEELKASLGQAETPPQ